MSRTPSANKNLMKGTAIRKAGFKSYMHSVLNDAGEPYYAWEATRLYNNGLGATKVIKELIKTYPAVEPPSVAAMNTFLKKYANVMVPQRTVNPTTRPDAMAAMYDSLEVMQYELKLAQKMRGDSEIALPVIRASAMQVVQVAEKIVQAEKSVGLSPVSLTLHQDNSTHVTNNTQNATQIIIGDPEKGRELLDAFKAFETEVSEYQSEPVNASI